MVNKLNFSRNLSSKYCLMALVAIKILGVAFATMVFAKYTPLVDSQLYLKGYYQIDPLLRTQIVHRMAVALNFIGGAFFTHFIFGMISVVGFVYYYLTGGKNWILMCFLFLPSSLVWTSIVGKEALFFGSMGLALVIWSKYVVEPLKLFDLVGLLIALIVCGLMRPHYAIAIFWIIFSTTLIKKLQARAIPILIIALLAFTIVCYITVWDNLLHRGFEGIDPTARASRFGSLNIDLNSPDAFERYKRLVPLGMIYGILGPLPSEVLMRIEFLPFLLEGIFIMTLPVMIFVIANKLQFSNKTLFFRFFFYCLVPAMLMLMVLHAPFGFLNPGSATRWRTDFEQMFYLAPLLLLSRFMDEKKEENSSFPH